MGADCRSQQDHGKQAGVYRTVLMGSVRGDTQAQTHPNRVPKRS